MHESANVRVGAHGWWCVGWGGGVVAWRSGVLVWVGSLFGVASAPVGTFLGVLATAGRAAGPQGRKVAR